MKLVLASLLAVTCAASTPTFQHSWDGGISSMMWVDFAFRLGMGSGAPNLTKTQADFVANNYAIVSLEKCLGEPENETLAVFRDWSRNLKAINPDLKILFYWNMQVRERMMPELWANACFRTGRACSLRVTFVSQYRLARRKTSFPAMATPSVRSKNTRSGGLPQMTAHQCH
jgi:hypothetical protein